jgi:hypothetical protein
MGRPLIGTRPLTNAEHQARYRARHGSDPGNAARQQRWRDRRVAEVSAEVKVDRAAQAAAVVDPQFVQAAAILTERGEVDLVGRLQASWPHMAVAVRQEMAAGRGFRFWLRD